MQFIKKKHKQQQHSVFSHGKSIKSAHSDNKNILRKPQIVATKPKHQQEQQQEQHAYHIPDGCRILVSKTWRIKYIHICMYLYLQASTVSQRAEREKGSASLQNWACPLNKGYIKTGRDRQVAALTFISFSNQKVIQTNKAFIEDMLYKRVYLLYDLQ